MSARASACAPRAARERLRAGLSLPVRTCVSCSGCTVGVSHHGAEEEASEAFARRLWGFCVFGANGVCGGGEVKMEAETMARPTRQTHSFWCTSLSEREGWLACLSQSIERAAGMPPVPLLPRTGWEASGRDLVEEMVDLAIATCTNTTKAGAAASGAGSWNRESLADLVQACAALACDLTKDTALARLPGHWFVGASGHRGVQRGGVTGCRGRIGEGHDLGEHIVSEAQRALPRDQLLLHEEEDTYRRRDQLRLDAHVKDVTQHEEADTCIASEAPEALRRDQLRPDALVQVLGLVDLLGLFCLYTGSLLTSVS